ncbi:MAG: hypothetical protein M3Z15_12435 [Pseudomonadota bacterium]|nr:hypothetical protein [Pseudomonadota bacterium]
MASHLRTLRRERAVLVAPLLVAAIAAPGCAVVDAAGKLVEKTVDVVVSGGAPK